MSTEHKTLIESDTRYEFLITADGTPSICLSSSNFRPEAMHHRQGALSESIYIYLEAFKESLNLKSTPSVLSIGLGCGYNEFLVVAQSLLINPFPSLYMESFEADPYLREGFIRWLLDSTQTTELRIDLLSELSDIFESVLKHVAAHFKVEKSVLKNKLRQLYEQGQWKLRNCLEQESMFSKKFSVIFYDAFSNQATPLLWTEEFLTQFLNKTADSVCVFATYAATGALNRSLKTTGFQRMEQPGFSGKRQSTRAVRS